MSLLLLGHNFRTTNARKSIKGSKGSEFCLVAFSRRNDLPGVVCFQASMTSSENHVSLLTFFTQKFSLKKQ